MVSMLTACNRYLLKICETIFTGNVGQSSSGSLASVIIVFTMPHIGHLDKLTLPQFKIQVNGITEYLFSFVKYPTTHCEITKHAFNL